MQPSLLVVIPSSSLTRPPCSGSKHSRLPSLSQPVDNQSNRDPARFLDISPHQNITLHQYDQDVVRELSLPPDSVNPIYPSQFYSHGFPNRQPELSTSSYLTGPHPQNVPIETFNRPRTPPVSAPPSFFAHHGLPASLPPPPRTTYYNSNPIPQQQQQQQEPVPEADNLVSYFDSILRGSYSQMLSNKSDSVPTSAPELPRSCESCASCSAIPSDQFPSTPRLRCCPLPPIAEPDFSIDDLLQPDSFDAGNSTSFEEFLTSPLLQDDSPEETPFIDTPIEDVWTSPMVDGADDSFGFSEMPLFGADVKRRQEESKPVESLDVFGLLQLYTPQESTAPETFESSKVETSTPLLNPLDSETLYTMPPTPALAPASLHHSPQLPPTLSLAPSSSSSLASSSKSTRTIKPTGTRRNITPSSLVPIDAPTQPRQYLTPSATSRKVVPAAFAKGKKRALSEVDGDDDDVEPSVADANLDPNTKDAIEAKRRQNTIAARRSRQRKLLYVRELEDNLERMKQDRDMWMTRAHTAESTLRAHGLSS